MRRQTLLVVAGLVVVAAAGYFVGFAREGNDDDLAAFADYSNLVGSESPPTSGSDDVPDDPNEIRVSFDLDREPKTRVRVLRRLTENLAASADETASEESAPAEPVVVTARLRGDLLDGSGEHEFPATQIVVAAAPEGASGLRLTVTANPAEPELVADGFYRGQIIVEGGGPEPFVIPLKVDLDDRTGGMWWAVLVLAFGAALGLGIKWVTEVAGTLGALRRKAARLSRYFAGREEGLPFAVKDHLSDALSRILTQETEGLREQLDAIDSRRVELASFARAILALNEKIARQLEGLPDAAPPAMSLAIQQEQELVTQLRSRPWPWPEKSRTVQDAVATAAHFDALSQLVACYPPSSDVERSKLLGILNLYATGSMKKGYEAWLSYVEQHQPGAGPAGERGDSAPRGVAGAATVLAAPPEGGRGLMDGILRHARKLAAFSSVIVVTIVGVQLEYLNSTSFGGTPSDWLNLFLWAFAIELSGVSLLEVVGRLTPGQPAAAGR